MTKLYSDGPIIACSTGRSSNTAIGLIRISGIESPDFLNESFSIDTTSILPNTAIVCDLLNDHMVIDNIVITYFAGPKSYNGENIFELSVHGNQINIQNILDLFTKKYPIRIAREGEFTYRALLNKKLSLGQVEGLDLLLNANSSLVYSNGLNSLQGNLQAEYKKLRDTYLMLKGAIELSIDFSDDMGTEESNELLSSFINSFNEQIEALSFRVKGDLTSFFNPNIVLVGKTNAGKSSLFNKLLMTNRSIVTAQAGTTRDYVSQSLSIDGTNYQLIDTAGIRETTDEIEEIGINKALEILTPAFYKILVVDPRQVNKEDYKLLSASSFDLLVLTHRDLCEDIDLNNLTNRLPNFSKYLHLNSNDNAAIAMVSNKSGSIGPDSSSNKSGSIGPDYLSNKSGSIGPDYSSNQNGSIGPDYSSNKSGSIGPNSSSNKSGSIGPDSSSNKGGSIGPILDVDGSNSLEIKNIFGDNLMALINEDVSSKYLKLHDSEPILIDRQRQSVNNISLRWAEFLDIYKNEKDIAIVASELHLIESELGELIGIISSDDVLNNLFANFCIGK